MQNESGYTTITSRELKQWLDKRKDYLLIDILPNEVFV